MTRSLLIACMAAVHAVAAGDGGDLLRFSNGDQLHGAFRGIGPGPAIIWQRDDITEPAQLQTVNLRHLVLRGGNPAHALTSLSHVTLLNGDQLPGTIRTLDASTITLESPIAGSTSIPRQMVSRIAPYPLGGRVHYHGPFSPDGWETVRPTETPAGPPGTDAANGSEGATEAPNHDANAPVWSHAGAAWYWHGKHHTEALIRRNCLPERYVLRFRLAWKQRPLIAIGINTDFQQAPAATGAADDDGQPRAGRQEPFISSSYRSMPLTFGNSQVLRIQSNYMSLLRTGVDNQGNLICDNLPLNNNRLLIDNSSQAEFEIRSNRLTGDVAVFIDGTFVTQWNLHEATVEKNGVEGDPREIITGNGFGILPQMLDAGLRVSDMVISDWNGNIDSARSQVSDDHDVMMLTNGLDRMAGTATRLTDDGRIEFHTKHGNIHVPLDEIAEIRFARKHLGKPPEPSQGTISLHFCPLGRLSGQPLQATRETLELDHPLLGKLALSTSAATMIEFNTTNSFINDWDDTF